MNFKQHKKVLAFFAHPDDETLACGGTLAKLTQMGIGVHVAIAATGIHSRRNTESQKKRDSGLDALNKDFLKAMKILGVRNVTVGDFSDNEMDRHSLLEIIHWLEAIIDNVKPTLVFTHHRFCTNIDHQYCHEAAVVATRPSINQHITLLSCEVPSSTGYLKPTQWEPNCYIELSKNDLQKKIKAMQAYKGEARPYPHPRSPQVIESLARVRGSESGFHFAESFMIQKIFG